jgi:hypothetical protein
MKTKIVRKFVKAKKKKKVALCLHLEVAIIVTIISL